MVYEVKRPILGFENITKVEFTDFGDKVFASVKDVDSDLSFTVVNPYSLREYSFDIPRDIQILLDINENSKLLVYNIVVLNEKLKDSVVNFKAPLIFNNDNQTCAQAVLDDYDDVAVRIGDIINRD